MPGIFASTYQAVQVAYAMAAASPFCCSNMQSIYRQMQADSRHKSSLDGGVDWSGLTVMEQRAECANIRDMIEHIYSGADVDVILAKFAQDELQVPAIQRMSTYIAPRVRGTSQAVVLDLLVWIYYDRKRRPSLRGIARHHGLSDRRVRDALQAVGEITDELETGALERIGRVLVRCGYVRG